MTVDPLGPTAVEDPFNKFETKDDMLTGGAAWAVDQGYGNRDDLGRIEENGRILHAKPGAVSDLAKKRQRDEMGTLGSGNHYLEVQEITEIFEPRIATAFGLQQGQVVVTIHCGSRGLGHQIGTEYLREMVIAAKAYGIDLPDRELACAPIASDLGERYLGAMRAATNCALANRQILTHRTREVFATVFPDAVLTLLYDVSHNTCKEESHRVDGRERMMFVHRKGATRAFGPGHPALPERLRETGQPVLVGGSMGNRIIHTGGCSYRRYRARIRLGLPRCWPSDEPNGGNPPMAWPCAHQRAGGARHRGAQPVRSRRCRRGAGRIQRRRCCRRCRCSVRSRPEGRTGRADRMHQGLGAAGSPRCLMAITQT